MVVMSDVERRRAVHIIVKGDYLPVSKINCKYSEVSGEYPSVSIDIQRGDPRHLTSHRVRPK